MGRQRSKELQVSTVEKPTIRSNVFLWLTSGTLPAATSGSLLPSLPPAAASPGPRSGSTLRAKFLTASRGHLRVTHLRGGEEQRLLPPGQLLLLLLLL
ncbi:unnamed protein product [Boreogadus saida]